MFSRDPSILPFRPCPFWALLVLAGCKITATDPGIGGAVTGTPTLIGNGQIGIGSDDGGAGDEAGDPSPDGSDPGAVPDDLDDDYGGDSVAVIGDDTGNVGTSDDGTTVNRSTALDDALAAVADQTWTYATVPGTYCRNGSTAGFSVNLNRADAGAGDKVLVFLQSGGGCFNLATCIANRANVAGFNQKYRSPSNDGIFDRSNASNPFRDWNFVYVPYCTGDIHAGTNASATVRGVLGTQKFVGYSNLQSFLQRVVTIFPNPSQVLLAGESAGGFGAVVNFPQVQRAFPQTKVQLIDDSGPVMGAQYLPGCLQDQWRNLWGLDGSIINECQGNCPNQDFALDYTSFLARKYADRTMGVIDAVNDSVIRFFFGYGAKGCTGALPTTVPDSTFQQGLLDFRSTITPIDPNFGTFFPLGNDHMWLANKRLYTNSAGGRPLISWIQDLVQGTAPGHFGPSIDAGDGQSSPTAIGQ